MNWKVLLFCLLAAPWARAETITLSNGEWLPYLSETLPHYGIVSRIVSEAFALEGITVQYVFRPWPRAYAEAQRGLVNGSLVWSVGPAATERAREFLSSDTVLEAQSVFFHRKGYHFKWTRDADLAGLRIGGVAGYEYRFEDVPGVHLDRAPNEELNLRKLVAGRVDVVAASLDVGRYILRTRFKPEEAAVITVATVGRGSTQYRLIMRRADAANAGYIERFNRGLRKLKESGKYEQYMADLEAGRY
ncbi:MAG TPA: transporter substrate-binding domain-containing protein [Pseudoduganella sp.]